MKEINKTRRDPPEFNSQLKFVRSQSMAGKQEVAINPTPRAEPNRDQQVTTHTRV